MKLFHRFHSLLFIAAAVLAVASFSACGDSDNGGSSNNDNSGYDKNTYYALEDTANGWDYGMYYNGKVILVHADTMRGTCLGYLNEMKSESKDGVCIEIDEEGNIVSFGTPNKLASVVEKDNKTYLCTADNNGGVAFAEVELDEKATKETRATSESDKLLWKNKKDVLKFFFNKTIDIADDAIKKKWGTKVFEPFKKAYNNLAKAANFTKMLRNGEWTQASLTVLKTGISAQFKEMAGPVLQGIDLLSYEYKEYKECMHDVFYGKAYCEITDVVKRSDDAYEVTVTIANSYTIPQEHRETVVAADGSEKMTYVKNEVYCGVLARKGYEPEYQYCDTRSGEILVKQTADDQEQTFVIYADEDNTLLRPFLMVDLDLTNKPNMRYQLQHIKYGKSIPLISANVDYTYKLENCCAYSLWDKSGQLKANSGVAFTLKFNATCNSLNNKYLTAVKDWGVVLYKGEKQESFISLMGENDNQSGIGQMTSESTQTFSFEKDELDINHATYTAKPKNYYIAPYVEYSTDFNTVERRIAIGKLEPFAPKYIQKPAAEFTGAEYSETYDTHTTVRSHYYDEGLQAYKETSVRVLYSVNNGFFNINGTLFVDSAFVRKSGSGWDQYSFGVINRYAQRERVPLTEISDGARSEYFTFYFQADSASAKPRYLTLELWSGGSCTSSKNKLVYKPLTLDNWGENVYHIYGFSLEKE